MSDQELIAMARLAQHDDRMATGKLYGDLADRIEQLEREQTRLHTQCDGLMQAGMNNGQALILAQAKLAKAIEALRFYAALKSDLARATLAELEGGE